jgi:hypothetical protein
MDWLGPFGVCPLPIKDGEIGDVQVAGVCRALVDIQDVTHRRAIFDPGSAILKSGHAGPVLILWAPASTSQQMCVVVLDAISARIGFIGVTTSGGISARNGLTLGTGQMTVYTALDGELHICRPEGEDGDPLVIDVWNIVDEEVDAYQLVKATVETTSWLPIVDVVPCGNSDVFAPASVSNVTSPDPDGNYIA